MEPDSLIPRLAQEYAYVALYSALLRTGHRVLRADVYIHEKVVYRDAVELWMYTTSRGYSVAMSEFVLDIPKKYMVDYVVDTMYGLRVMARIGAVSSILFGDPGELIYRVFYETVGLDLGDVASDYARMFERMFVSGQVEYTYRVDNGRLVVDLHRSPMDEFNIGWSLAYSLHPSKHQSLCVAEKGRRHVICAGEGNEVGTIYEDGRLEIELSWASMFYRYLRQTPMYVEAMHVRDLLKSRHALVEARL